MSNRPSQPTGPTLQPFRLLDLPRELLVPIVRSYRNPILENIMLLVIYRGEENLERYELLRRLCLTHRDILPFAQEELFKRLDIRDDEGLDLLNRSIASSERCKRYAGRAESIFLEEDVDPDGLMESGVFNPRELSSSICTLNFSLLNRFQNLRRIHVDLATFDEPLIHPNLESYSIGYLQWDGIDTPAAIKSANLLNLRRLVLRRLVLYQDYARVSVGQLYDSIIPQLDHLFLRTLPVADVEHLLVLSTSLQSLRVEFSGPHDDVSKVHDQISRIDVKDLHYHQRIKRESSDNWETDFESIQKFKEWLRGKDGLKRVELDFMFIYSERPSDDVCDQALARWKAIEGELESICAQKGTEVVTLTCCLAHGHEDIWAA